MDQHFFWDDNQAPMRRINNTLTPQQAIKIVEKAEKQCEGNESLKNELKVLKEWLKSKN